MSAPPEIPGVRHEYVNSGGLRMHVALAGPDDAPAVVLVHGWPQNWWTWREVIPVLAAGHRVIAIDLRGHGWSEAPAAGYDKEQLAGDVLGALDVLGVQRFTWIGHDWGGWSGLLAALRAPERIERLLVMCVPHPWIPPHPRRLLMLGYQGPISMPWLGLRIARPMVRSVLQAGRGRDRLPAADVAIFDEHIPPHVTVAMYRTFLTREVLPIARGSLADQVLAVPTTVLVGDRDLVTRGTVDGPVAGQPQLHVETIAGVAHWIPEQRPEAVTGWLARG
jgi:pimeloyl-ACP methyl ester carboxylesterase